ncbi:MAG: transposase [Zoogloeaceae bacterium]|nr:transposase [Zoogloeaceae bacterium]
MPWPRLSQSLAPHYPEALQTCWSAGQEALLRLYLMQQWFKLSPAELLAEMAHAPHMRAFARLGAEKPDAQRLERTLEMWRQQISQKSPRSLTALTATLKSALSEVGLVLQWTAQGATLWIAPEPDKLAPRLATLRDRIVRQLDPEAAARKAKRVSALRWLIVYAVLIYGGELLLAIQLSATWVKNVPQLLAFASVVEQFAPVVGHFDRIARYPEGTRVFLALTLALLPLKMLFGYKLLTSNDKFTYHNFVVSPLSRDKENRHTGVFIRDVESQFSMKRHPAKQRSLISVAFASLFIVLFAIGIACYSVLMFGSEIPSKGIPAETIRSLKSAYRAIAIGGTSAWLAWCVWWWGVTSLVLTAALCVVRDWVVFIFSKLKGS